MTKRARKHENIVNIEKMIKINKRGAQRYNAQKNHVVFIDHDKKCIRKICPCCIEVEK